MTEEIITLRLSWDELARLRFLANATQLSAITYWIEADRVQALGTVLDRNGWTTDKVVARLEKEFRQHE